MGLGKAQPLDATVMTPLGRCRMGDVRVGSFVVGMDGKPKVVKGVFPQGVKKTYKVTFSDGSSTECCDEHLWSVRTSMDEYLGKDFKVRKTSELMNDLRDTSGNLKWGIPITKKVEYIGTRHVIPPYTLGVLIGDGSLSHGNVTLTNASEHIYRRVVEDVSIDIDLIARRIPVEKNNTFKISIVRSSGKIPFNRFSRELERLNLNTTAYYKHIPSEYLFGTSNVREDLLCGLLDTDGYVAKDGTIQYTSASLRLCEDVRFLAQSLGCVVAPTKHKKTNIDTDAYTVTLKIAEGLNVISKPEKLSRIKKIVKYKPCRKIVSIDFVGYKESQCISVEGEHYLTDQYIVTHNTLSSLEVARHHLSNMRMMGVHNPKFLVIMPKSASSTWRAQCMEHTPDMYNSMVMLPYSRLKEARQLVMYYDFRLVICDESHYLKNPEALRSDEMANLLNLLHESRGGFKGGRFVFLSGTPMLNNAAELYSTWAVLGSPNVVEASIRLKDPDRYEKWAKNFSKRKESTWEKFGGIGKDGKAIKQTKKGSTFEGVDNVELLNKLLAPIVHYRRVSDCIDLPEKEEIPIDLNIDDDKLLKDADIEKPEAHMALLERLSRAKAPHMIEWVSEFLKYTPKDEQLVVFSMYKEPIFTLKEKFPKDVVLVTGDESTGEREGNVLAFQSGKKRVIALTYGAGSEALNLQMCKKALYLGYPWTDGKLRQAMARIWRQGQSDFTLHYFLTSGQNDRRILRLVRSKEEATTEVEDALLTNKNDVPQIWQPNIIPSLDFFI